MQSFLASIRHCSSALLNRIVRQDPEAAKAVRAEEADAAPARPMVYHPAAAEYLRSKRFGDSPHMPLSG